MDTSSDEFFSATEELLSSAEDEDEDVDGLSDSVSFQCRVSGKRSQHYFLKRMNTVSVSGVPRDALGA